MADWLTPDAVAAYLGDSSLAADPNLATACTGLQAYLQAFRVDVFGVPGAPAVDPVVVPADLVFGAIMWAAHAYQVRSAPSGFAGYGDGAGDAMFDLSLASNRADIFRLVGLKKPVTA